MRKEHPGAPDSCRRRGCFTCDAPVWSNGSQIAAASPLADLKVEAAASYPAPKFGRQSFAEPPSVRVACVGGRQCKWVQRSMMRFAPC
eukprot:565138-Amphidinium_carterae.1